MREVKVLAFSGALLMGGVLSWLIAFALQPTDTAQSPKRLIYYGWGTRDTMFVREHFQEMEEMPFDGIGISVAIDRKAWQQGRTDTTNKLDWNIFGPKAFRLDDFLPAIEDLKAAKWRKFTDNFAVACICSSGQDFNFNWFDDTRWKTIVNNWRILVTIAKEGGLKGIIVDPEQYGAYFFCYPEMNQRFSKPFAEYVAKVRERGRSLMEVTKKIFPDITLLFFWTHSYLVLHPTHNGWLVPPEKNTYGLLPAFLDGILEAADLRTKFVDLSEFAYSAKERQRFLEIYHSIINKAPLFSAIPEVYRAKVRVGFGISMDIHAHGKPQLWSTTDFSKHHFSPEEFKQALQTALELSDEYVWIYTQYPKFFPPSNLPVAYLQAIREAKEAIR